MNIFLVRVLSTLFHFFHVQKYDLSPEQMKKKARGVVNYGALRAFRLFRDEKFRQKLRFGQIEEEEQNRIFNELVVTNLMLVMLMLDQRIRETEGERKEYYQKLREEVPRSFIRNLSDMGIPNQFVKMWEKLVGMRYEEYEEDTLYTRGEFLKHEDAEMHEFALDMDLMAFQALSVGSCYHLVRGNADEGVPLFRKLWRPYLLDVYRVMVRKIN